MQRETTSFVKVLAVLSGLLWFSACAVNCQPAGAPLTTITNQQFRLISSSDPTLQNVTNTNFITITFSANYTGQVQKVQNNNLFNNPALVFSYNIDPNSNTLKIQYSTPPTNDQSGGGSSSDSGGTQVGPPKTYNYTLNTGLTLTDTTSGYVYQWVPFQGIVLPDQQCTFSQ
jgi:hypothetical protein